MSIVITEIAAYQPGEPIDNETIINRHGLRMKADWVDNRIGIVTRHWAHDSLAASDLAVHACEKLNLGSFRGPIWLSTISPDYFTPSTSVLTKRKLGLKDSHPTFDLNSACAGFLFTLAAAQSWLETHPETEESLVIATEMRSKFLNKQDRRTVFLFSDGAVAVRLSKSASRSEGIEWVDAFSICSDSDEIFVPGGGSREPLTAESMAQGKQYITMVDGQKISAMATEALAESLKGVFAARKVTIEDFDLVISHQANQMINQKLFEILHVKAEQIFTNLHKTGNCSSASIGLALEEAHRSGRLKKGHRVLLIAMGAGYHFAAASICWGDGQ